MDPTKYRFRYLVGILLTAALVAAALRHALHVGAGFTRGQILGGALSASAIGLVIILIFVRRRRHH
jgi:hypothetical protein